MEFISEQQKSIVLSNAQYKLINGCAGSRKTDTLIKCAITDLETHKRPILFLTLVGSVTDEIKTRLETQLAITIEKQGYSNHYIGYYNNISICISNYDAWVHVMLSTNENLDDIGNCYNEKVNILLELSKTDNIICCTKNNDKVGLLIIDEVQDLQSNKMTIITNLSKTSKELDIYCAGDYLQTLFSDDANMNLDYHSMNIFKRINPIYFDLNMCKRCPKAHIDFNNLLLGDIQKKYSIPPILSDNENIIDKPFLFTHYKTSDNTNARITAEKITLMIKILMENDKTISPNDIAIIMAKSNNNLIYCQLQDTLANLYKILGFPDSIIYMSTYSDGAHNSLNWCNAEGKTKMLSIHGDKGRGHKVVFFLGVTENSIPRSIYINKSSEIIPESLLNVGITRSTKYLFIGFAYSYPSRYLQKKHTDLGKFTYSSWNTINIPEPYKSINIGLNQTNLVPKWDKQYNNEKILTGTNSNLAIKNDIAKGFEHPKNLVSHDWKKSIHSTFGNIQPINIPLQEDHYVLIGTMTELLIQRIINKRRLFTLLKESSSKENNIYTDDERFLSCMYDIKRKYNLYSYVETYKYYFKQNIELLHNIKDAVNRKKNVVHKIFTSDNFQKDLELFLSDVENKNLNSGTIWNVTLYYNQITQKEYRPAINSYLGYYNEDISILHDNITTFIETYMYKNSVIFEKYLLLQESLNPKELNKVNVESQHIVSIGGSCDIYDITNEQVYEIKASRLKMCSEEWITQAIMYGMMLDVYNKPVKYINVVNLLNGCIWKWEVDLPKIEDIINKLVKRYEWHKVEVIALLRSIKDKRSKQKMKIM